MSPMVLAVFTEVTCQSRASTRTLSFWPTRGVQSSVARMPQDFFFAFLLGASASFEAVRLLAADPPSCEDVVLQPANAPATARRAMPPMTRPVTGSLLTRTAPRTLRRSSSLRQEGRDEITGPPSPNG